MLIGKTAFRESQTNSSQDVQRAAAADGGGAAEEGGQHQAHLRLPGRGGHQEICWGPSLRGLAAQWFPGKKG